MFFVVNADECSSNFESKLVTITVPFNNTNSEVQNPTNNSFLLLVIIMTTTTNQTHQQGLKSTNHNSF